MLSSLAFYYNRVNCGTGQGKRLMVVPESIPYINPFEEFRLQLYLDPAYFETISPRAFFEASTAGIKRPQ